jgi:hypothetical protein
MKPARVSNEYKITNSRNKIYMQGISNTYSIKLLSHRPISCRAKALTILQEEYDILLCSVELERRKQFGTQMFISHAALRLFF